MSRRLIQSRIVATLGSSLLLVIASCGGSAAPSAAPESSPAAAPSSPAAKPSTIASSPAAAPASSAAAKPSAAVSAAASTAAKPSAAAKPSPAADWQAQWDRAVAAGKQEGKVTVIMPPGDQRKQVLDNFTKKYGIETELLQGGGNADLVPRIGIERKGEQYLWDVVLHAPSVQYVGLKGLNAMDPLRPALILPEILDDSKWIGGFEAGWADKDSAQTYAFIAYLIRHVWVNRQFVPEGQLNKFDQLWDPQWKGKIAWQDPRVLSSGALAGATILVEKGEDKLRTFMQNQQPVLTRDFRQLAEWFVRGQYPISIGIDLAILEDFKSQGIDLKKLEPLDPNDPGETTITFSAGSVGLFNRAPHPNAAKVFINYALGKEGAELYSKTSGYNNRRTDVAVVDPTSVVDPTKKYVNFNHEDNFGKFARVPEIAQEVMK